jgi:hypothetical protein
VETVDEGAWLLDTGETALSPAQKSKRINW